MAGLLDPEDEAYLAALQRARPSVAPAARPIRSSYVDGLLMPSPAPEGVAPGSGLPPTPGYTEARVAAPLRAGDWQGILGQAGDVLRGTPSASGYEPNRVAQLVVDNLAGPAGTVGGGARAARRGRRSPNTEQYPTSPEPPRFKVEPQANQTFDDWLDAIYSPSARGADNVTRFPSLMYRGVSDAELRASIEGGSIRPISGPALYIENSPDRYTGGGAYGARRGGAILQFDVGGLPSVSIPSSHARGLVEAGVPEVPIDRITRVWRWDPERGGHVLLSQEQMADLLRQRALMSGMVGGGGAAGLLGGAEGDSEQ